MDISINLKDSDLPHSHGKACKGRIHTWIFHQTQRNYSTKWSKYRALGPIPASLEMLQSLPLPSTAISERYCSSIGLVCIVLYGCPSASQMLLPFFNCTWNLDSIFTQGTETSPRLVYSSLLLFTFGPPSGSLTCYFSILALERKLKFFSTYLCQVIIPGFRTSSIYCLFFLFP